LTAQRSLLLPGETVSLSLILLHLTSFSPTLSRFISTSDVASDTLHLLWKLTRSCLRIGTGDAKKTAVESGKHALNSGLRHVDTAQGYHNEKETGECISKSGVDRKDIYLTTKSEPILSQTRSFEPEAKRLA